MAGSPALSVAFSGTADIKALGVSAELNYERSVGASASFRDGAGSKRVSMTQSHMGGRVFVRRVLRERYTVRAGAGYHQLGFKLSNKPNGLQLHDARYSYADLGAGLRVSVRDDRVALTLDGAYMHVLALSGITAPEAYGSAAARGFRGEAGLELVASETTFVRVALTYKLITLYFDGSGELTKDLDDSPDVNVTGAQDRYVGGVAMMGFHF